MSSRAQLSDILLVQLDEAFERKAWHGATLWGTLRRVNPEEAAWRPAPDRHNIREITVHCAYWKYIVRRRLTGDRRRTFPLSGQNWFERPGEDGSDWEFDRALLREQHEALRAVVVETTPDELRTPRGSADPIEEIRGIANHDIYHTGQIRLLRVLRDVDG